MSDDLRTDTDAAWRGLVAELACRSDEIEMLRAALADERAHADALAGALHDIMGAYSEPDMRICCSGHMCGCRGSTVREMADHYAAEALDAHRARRQG